MRVTLPLIALGVASAVLAVGTVGYQVAFRPLVTGRWITPEGFQQEVGSFPTNMALSPDGKYVVVTNTSYREYLSVLDSDSGALVSRLDFNGNKKALYYGLAFAKQGDKTLLFASRGGEDLVSVYELTAKGQLEPIKDLHNPAPEDGSKLPHHIAGLATNEDGIIVYAVNNQTHEKNGLHGSVSVIDVAKDEVVKTIPVDGFPLAIAAIGGKLFVSSERDGLVTVVDPEAGTVVGRIETGSLPAYLKVGNGKLYCANSGSDTISEIDPAAMKVTRTILVRPAAFRGLSGSTPLGMDLTPDGKRMFVAMADLNAVAVVDLGKGELEGYLPAGWYPTSVVVSQNGDRLLVANAKGVKSRNPNGSPVRKVTRNQYGASILEGTVASIDLSQELGTLPEHTEQVLRNNRADGYAEASAKAFKNPGIEHVVYIVKENRTYDQVLGDVPRGNGNPSLVMFGRDVTPNQHALVERFALLDNFYVCAEVSADGWNWSTSGMANEYNERNVFVNYSGRGRNYDFEGTNNGFAPSTHGKRDVSESDGGYIWDSVTAKGLSLRNFGMYVAFDPDNVRPESREMKGDGVPTKPALVGTTSETFRRYDTAYADSEAWVEYGLSPAPRQLAKYGPMSDPSRMTAWKREFAEMVKKGKMPQLMLVRLGRDHTAGTTAGEYSPRAMVADNDYAVGQLVDAISHSPFWKKTAIFIVEDDAQAGFDHIDSHRSPSYVISPFVPKATHDRTFYNTDSVLGTICLLLGTKPMNSYVASATPFQFFGKSAANAEPFTAIRPDKAIISEVNSREAYRAGDSARMINRFQEESAPDIELNDILWGSIKGAKSPRPTTPNARWKVKDADGDGDDE